MTRHALCAFATLCAFTALAPAQTTDGDHYYVTLYGGYGNILRPRTGHTWATFTHAAPGVDGGTAVEQQTISWLPASLRIRPFALRTETGVNLTHEQTMTFMESHRLPRVTAFGPYEIDAGRYAQLVQQKALLESGAIQYHALGKFGRRADVMHCIDAVTRTDPVWELEANPSHANGERGTAQAVKAMNRSGFADTTIRHPHTLPAIPSGSLVRMRER